MMRLREWIRRWRALPGSVRALAATVAGLEAHLRVAAQQKNRLETVVVRQAAGLADQKFWIEAILAVNAQNPARRRDMVKQYEAARKRAAAVLQAQQAPPTEPEDAA